MVSEGQAGKGRGEEQDLGKGGEDRVWRDSSRLLEGWRSLTAEGTVPPGGALAGMGTQRCVGLQGAAEGQGGTLGPTLAVHTTGEAGVRGYHPMALGEGSWRVKPWGCERREEAREGSKTRQLLEANLTSISIKTYVS